MSKVDRGAAIVRLVAWSIVAIILITLFCAMLGGEAIGIHSIFSVGYFFDDSDYNIGNCEYKETVKDVTVHWESGSVSIVYWDGDGVKVTESGDIDGENERMRSRIDGDELVIYCVGSGMRLINSLPPKSLTVYIPKELSGKLGDLKVDAIAATVSVGSAGEPVSWENAEVDSFSGDIAFFGDADEIAAGSFSGKISICGDFKALTASSFSGRIEAEGDINEASFESFSGAIVYKAESVNPDEIYGETFSGNIELSLVDDGDGFDVELDSLSGKISWEGGSGRYYKFGNGSSDYDFEGFSGNITVKVGK